MKRFPETPPVDDAPEGLFDGGHLWILELVDGLALRFRLQESGALAFGDTTRTLDAADPPAPYRAGIRHVREHVDREGLRAAVDDVSSVVFFGVVPCARFRTYDWERTPAFLGVDVWSGVNERYLPPDSVATVYDRLGLDSAPVFQTEVDATYFDVDDYEVPDSTLGDGPAKGALFANKTGQRAFTLNQEVEERAATSRGEASPEELADRLATDRRVEDVGGELSGSGRSVTFDAVFERVFERAVREEYATLFKADSDARTPYVDAGEPSVDLQSLRSEMAARVQEILNRHE